VKDSAKAPPRGQQSLLARTSLKAWELASELRRRPAPQHLLLRHLALYPGGERRARRIRLGVRLGRCAIVVVDYLQERVARAQRMGARTVRCGGYPQVRDERRTVAVT